MLRTSRTPALPRERQARWVGITFPEAGVDRVDRADGDGAVIALTSATHLRACVLVLLRFAAAGAAGLAAEEEADAPRLGSEPLAYVG